MERYAIIQVLNGNFSVVSEWTDLSKAIANFHTLCATLWNDPDVERATVVLYDERMIKRKLEYVKCEHDIL